jgi:hypothetical protein
MHCHTFRISELIASQRIRAGMPMEEVYGLPKQWSFTQHFNVTDGISDSALIWQKCSHFARVSARGVQK